MSLRRFLLLPLGALVFAGLVVLAVGYGNATAPPVVRYLSLRLPEYPEHTRPVRILFFADLHAHWPETSIGRIDRVVDEINDLHPDMVVAGGDFAGNSSIGGDYTIGDAVAPLRRLDAPLGVYAVLGNIDYRYGGNEVATALQRAGVKVLMDQVARAGPIAIGGLDGRLRSYAAATDARHRTYDALRRAGGVKLLLAHRPDEFHFTPDFISLVLSGHTHCGQIVLPRVGALETGSDYGSKYLCGPIREGPKLLVVTAGVGTSKLPLRFGAPSDIWVIEIGGVAG